MTNTRIIPCPACGGDKGHDVPYDIDRSNGNTIDRWQPCTECGATGDIEIEVRPLRREDYRNAFDEPSSNEPFGDANAVE